MFWPSYATPAQSPWGLPPDMSPSPTASWSIHAPARSAFELPILRADVTAYEDPADDVSKTECDPPDDPPALAEIKEERISPEPPGNDVLEKADPPMQQAAVETGDPLDTVTSVDHSSIRVRDNLTTGWISQDPSTRSPKSVSRLDDRNTATSPSPVSAAAQHDSSMPSADYSGLQLLSDSIERFVSADQAKLAYQHQPEPIRTGKDQQRRSDNPMAVEVAGNGLDVLCAAALYQQSDPPKSSVEPRREMVPATSCIPSCPTGFQMEFDFRSKLAELQRKYKEKQKELSSLSN